MRIEIPIRNRQGGYASLAMVGAIAVVTGLGMMYSFRGSIRSQDSQVVTQTRIDHAQREDAFLRAVVALVPNKAIGAMKDGSAGTASEFSWQTIFNEAIDLARAEEAIDAAVLTALGVPNAVVANPGDGEIAQSTEIISPILSGTGFVNSGTEDSAALLFSNKFGHRLPDPLVASAAVMGKDANYPLITREKEFSSAYTDDAQLSTTQYPLYNVIPYPNVRFGYKRPGDLFVAKRNWWGFSVQFNQPNSDLPPMMKHYVLSIYELPSQNPISADAFLRVGRHSDGTEWLNTAVDGGVSGGVLETHDSFNLATGQLVGRDAMIVGDGTTAYGQTVNSAFDSLGVRETIHANQQNDQYVASLSANSGRVAFVPIARGLDFYNLPAITETATLSPTGWDSYSTGAVQCRMQLRVIGVRDALDQTPMKLEWKMMDNTGPRIMTLERGVNWPYPLEPGGDTVPFQTEHLETGRKALVVYTGRIAAYLAAQGMEGPTVNKSLHVSPDPSRHPDIKVPEFPTVGTDIALVIRDSEDFSAYANGFSLVTNLRLYLGDDFNQVAIAPPAGSGLPPGMTFFPPVSLFAPEQRFGTTLKIRPVDYSGQVHSLAEGENFAIHPLDFRAGTYETVTPSLISADLKPIESPAELPPIYLMNWLVTVEEIHGGR